MMCFGTGAGYDMSLSRASPASRPLAVYLQERFKGVPSLCAPPYRLEPSNECACGQIQRQQFLCGQFDDGVRIAEYAVFLGAFCAPGLCENNTGVLPKLFADRSLSAAPRHTMMPSGLQIRISSFACCGDCSASTG